MVRPAGIEPALPAPEAGALSPELRAHNLRLSVVYIFRHLLLSNQQYDCREAGAPPPFAYYIIF